jgi:hypothetical protein
MSATARLRRAQRFTWTAGALADGQLKSRAHRVEQIRPLSRCAREVSAKRAGEGASVSFEMLPEPSATRGSNQNKLRGGNSCHRE